MPDHQHINHHVQAHSFELMELWSNPGDTFHKRRELEDKLLDFILSELAKERSSAEGEMKHLLKQVLEKQNETLRKVHKIMIDQATIEASISRLETAVHNLIAALPGNQTPSTPDTVVTSLLGREDGLSTAAEAALAGTGTTPPPPAPPTP